MPTYYNPDDPATAAFITEAMVAAQIHTRERRAATMAASIRSWPAVPRTIIARAISVIDDGCKLHPALVTPRAKIFWNFGKLPDWLESVGSVLTRIAKEN